MANIAVADGQNEIAFHTSPRSQPHTRAHIEKKIELRKHTEKYSFQLIRIPDS